MLKKGNVLFVSYHFPPSVSPGSLRVTTFVRYLAAKGWGVSVVSAKHSATGAADPSSLGRVPENVRVERTGSIELYHKIHEAVSPGNRTAPPTRKRAPSLLKRILKFPFMAFYQLTRFPDKQVGWFLPLVLRLHRVLNEDNIDVVVSSSPPHSSQLATLLVRRMRAFKWIVDFRDPWTQPSRHPKTRLSGLIQRRMEKSVLKRCDVIIANTPGNKAALETAFPSISAGKICVVTNGYDVAPGEADHPPQEDSDCDIVYVGEVYTEMLDLFVEALCIIKNNDARALPRVHLFGNVDEREYAKVVERGLDDVVVPKGFVSWERSLQLMRAARSLLLLLPHQERWRTCVPSKLYPYLAAGKPVLAVVPPGDAAAIVEETNVGLALTTSDPAELAVSVQKFVEDLRLSRLDFAGRGERIHRYSMETLSQRIDDMLTKLVSS